MGINIKKNIYFKSTITILYILFQINLGEAVELKCYLESSHNADYEISRFYGFLWGRKRIEIESNYFNDRTLMNVQLNENTIKIKSSYRNIVGTLIGENTYIENIKSKIMIIKYFPRNIKIPPYFMLIESSGNIPTASIIALKCE